MRSGRGSNPARRHAAPSTLGDRIRKYRIQADLSQVVTAERIGRSEGWLIKVENGRASPNYSDLVRLAGLFEVTVTELIEARVANVDATRSVPVRSRSSARDEMLSVGDPFCDPAIPDLSGIAGAGRTRAGLTPAMIEGLEGITARHRTLYWTLPADYFISTVVVHLRLAASLLRTPTGPPDLGKRLLAASAETALLAGRILFFDLRREAEALRYLTAALDLAQTAGDPQLTAAAFAHMAFIPGFAGKLLDAQDHMRGAALHASRGATQNVRAWLGAVESEVAARSGDHRAGVAAIVRAEELYEGAASPADPPWFDWFSPELLASFAGYTYMRAGDLVVARDRLTGAIAGLPAERIKQRVVLLADLARVEVERREIEEASRLLVESMTPLSATGYATGLERVREVRGELDGWRNEPAVRRLDEVLYGVG